MNQNKMHESWPDDTVESGGMINGVGIGEFERAGGGKGDGLDGGPVGVNQACGGLNRNGFSRRPGGRQRKVSGSHIPGGLHCGRQPQGGGAPSECFRPLVGMGG